MFETTLHNLGRRDELRRLRRAVDLFGSACFSEDTLIVRLHLMHWNASRSVAQLRKRSVRLFSTGSHFQAKFGRTGFRRNFSFESVWRNRHYAVKQVEAFAVRDGEDWLVITVVTHSY